MAQNNDGQNKDWCCYYVSLLNKTCNNIELIKQTLGLFYKNIYFKFSGLILIHNSVTDVIGN